MELQLVSYDQAKALKELGFPQDLVYGMFYFEILESINTILFCGIPITNKYIVCPTLELAAKWLREDKNIYLHIKRLFSTSIIKHKDCYCLHYSTKNYDETLYVHEFDSYEQALSAGIDKAIEILKSKS